MVSFKSYLFLEFELHVFDVNWCIYVSKIDKKKKTELRLILYLWNNFKNNYQTTDKKCADLIYIRSSELVNLKVIYVSDEWNGM